LNKVKKVEIVTGAIFA